MREARQLEFLVLEAEELAPPVRIKHLQIQAHQSVAREEPEFRLLSQERL
jgi:hypothetical protein